MQSLTEPQIRASFVNCSKGEARRLNLPRDLTTTPWGDLDYLGWRDPQAPERGYVVAPLDDGLRGLVLRTTNRGGIRRAAACSLCLTTHTGAVALMVAPRAGRAGQQGNTVGTYVCSDLACSLYLRGLRSGEASAVVRETLPLEAKVARLMGNLATFVRQVTG
ncbi:FBP domain-containing protein [Nocardioides sp. SYSU D00038]|uniref:FBP domain-containing protein n=1 Tax=Nocardioides sp. SYSU D00038 TaxID=2812554 RepID=UPI001967DE84|nr:FBP domain-containing protein [Nocardioides sp. SYSU D00038]